MYQLDSYSMMYKKLHHFQNTDLMRMLDNLFENQKLADNILQHMEYSYLLIYTFLQDTMLIGKSSTVDLIHWLFFQLDSWYMHDY